MNTLYKLYARFIKWLCAPVLADMADLKADLQAALSQTKAEHIDDISVLVNTINEHDAKITHELYERLTDIEERFEGKLSNILSISLEASSKMVTTANKSYTANIKDYVDELFTGTYEQ